MSLLSTCQEVYNTLNTRIENKFLELEGIQLDWIEKAKAKGIDERYPLGPLNGSNASYYQAIEIAYETFNFIQLYLAADMDKDERTVAEYTQCTKYLKYLAYAHYKCSNKFGTYEIPHSSDEEFQIALDHFKAYLHSQNWVKMIDIFEVNANIKDVKEMILKFSLSKKKVDITFEEFLREYLSYLENVLKIYQAVDIDSVQKNIPSAPLAPTQVVNEAQASDSDDILKSMPAAAQGIAQVVVPVVPLVVDSAKAPPSSLVASLPNTPKDQFQAPPPQTVKQESQTPPPEQSESLKTIATVASAVIEQKKNSLVKSQTS